MFTEVGSFTTRNDLFIKLTKEILRNDNHAAEKYPFNVYFLGSVSVTKEQNLSQIFKRNT